MWLVSCRSWGMLTQGPVPDPQCELNITFLTLQWRWKLFHIWYIRTHVSQIKMKIPKMKMNLKWKVSYLRAAKSWYQLQWFWFVIQYSLFIVKCCIIPSFVAHTHDVTVIDQGYARLNYFFTQHFKSIKSLMEYHHYCDNCMSKVNDLSSKEWENCGYDLLDQKNSCFIEFPIVNQLTTLLKKPDFYQDIQYSYSSKKYHKKNIGDICDEVIYIKKYIYRSWSLI